MINVCEKQVAGLPVLEVVDAKLMHEKLPLVLFYHGWTNRKESFLMQGYELAKLGMRVVLPEALYHGVRADGPVEDHAVSFWQITINSVQEFPKIVDHYRKQDLLLNEQVGVGGFSMGGITTCMLMAQYPEINAGVVVSGTPSPVEFAKIILNNLPAGMEVSDEEIQTTLTALADYDLSLHPQKIGQRPLHFWHGNADPTVPCNLTQDFYENIKNQPSALHVSAHFSEGAVHKMSDTVTDEMIEKIKEFLL
ncbi:hypothetical protein LFYK43_15470 [Ligilactobacillus salitolerans]|uniref:AB hydrolase-1 domain-containing protein n=1 Tax=Ligilactobacillus salitolerans TaxID=1808352 RepID=A0A401IUA4_9LACO|nr:alpha/beta fold hydrolase [Ligilactobacillus salitolerans]GBG95088.1 hypothetical protein LFYK43_15470 [Ligilactobacillus salitolerans]